MQVFSKTFVANFPAPFSVPYELGTTIIATGKASVYVGQRLSHGCKDSVCTLSSPFVFDRNIIG